MPITRPKPFVVMAAGQKVTFGGENAWATMEAAAAVAAELNARRGDSDPIHDVVDLGQRHNTGLL